MTVTLPTPAKPSGFSATAGDGQVTLSWTDPSDSSITRYQLQQDEGDWADITGSGATTTEHVVYGLTNGDEYSFAILAVNANGSGPASDTERATPIGAGATNSAPAKPSGFSATAGDGHVTLSWTDPEDSSIDVYQLQQDGAPGLRSPTATPRRSATSSTG